MVWAGVLHERNWRKKCVQGVWKLLTHFWKKWVFCLSNHRIFLQKPLLSHWWMSFPKFWKSKSSSLSLFAFTFSYWSYHEFLYIGLFSLHQVHSGWVQWGHLAQASSHQTIKKFYESRKWLWAVSWIKSILADPMPTDWLFQASFKRLVTGFENK